MSELHEPTVILVDESDRVVGQEKKQKAHELGLCHRAFSVFILKNPKNIQVLMQKRSEKKYHCGGLWTNTCCSHPAPNQDTKTAAKSRLTMEMGLTCDLNYAGVFHYIAHFDNGLTENEVDHVFYEWHNHEASINPNPDEVDDYQWMPLTELKQALVETPSQFTPWLKQALSLVEHQLLERSHRAD
jgi:isopentenyl-diphosphate Delta-isomerase